MTNVQIADRLAEKLRAEPYRLLNNNCLTKSVRLKRECEKLGIPARAIACIGVARARIFGRWITVPVLHGWGEVEGKRIETSRPLGHSWHWDIVPMNIKPVIKVRFR